MAGTAKAVVHCGSVHRVTAEHSGVLATARVSGTGAPRDRGHLRGVGDTWPS